MNGSSMSFDAPVSGQLHHSKAYAHRVPPFTKITVAFARCRPAGVTWMAATRKSRMPARQATRILHQLIRLGYGDVVPRAIDARTTGATGGADKELPTVGEIDRAA